MTTNLNKIKFSDYLHNKIHNKNYSNNLIIKNLKNEDAIKIEDSNSENEFIKNFNDKRTIKGNNLLSENLKSINEITKKLNNIILASDPKYMTLRDEKNIKDSLRCEISTKSKCKSIEDSLTYQDDISNYCKNSNSLSLFSSLNIKIINNNEKEYHLEYYLNINNSNDVYLCIISDLNKISNTINNIGNNIEYFINSTKNSCNFLNIKLNFQDLIKNLYTVISLELNDNILFISNNKQSYKTPFIKAFFENNKYNLDENSNNVIEIINSIFIEIKFENNNFEIYIFEDNKNYVNNIEALENENINNIVNNLIESADEIYNYINNIFNKISILINHIKIKQLNK